MYLSQSVQIYLCLSISIYMSCFVIIFILFCFYLSISFFYLSIYLSQSVHTYYLASSLYISAHSYLSIHLTIHQSKPLILKSSCSHKNSRACACTFAHSSTLKGNNKKSHLADYFTFIMTYMKGVAK